jgi:hypothetical protein
MPIADADGQQLSGGAHRFDAEMRSVASQSRHRTCRSPCAAFMQDRASEAIPFLAILR